MQGKNRHFEAVTNGAYVAKLDELRRKAGGLVGDTVHPVFRLLQIEEKAKRHVASLTKRHGRFVWKEADVTLDKAGGAVL